MNTSNHVMDQNLLKIFKEGVLIDIDVRKWTGSKALVAEDLGLKAENVSKVFTLGHVDLVPKERINEFKRIEGQARVLVEKNSHPFPFGSARFVTKRCFIKVLKELKELRASYNTLIDDLVINYDKYRAEMQAEYKEAAEKAYITQAPELIEFGPGDLDTREADFVNAYMARINSYALPVSEIPGRFSLDWGIYSISLPGLNSSDGEDVIMDEETRLEIAENCKNKVSAFMDNVVKVLREETVEVCGHIRDSIVSGKVIRGPTIQSLRDFIDRYSDLNFLGDGRIGAQLEDLRKELLEGHDDLGENEDLKSQLKVKLSGIVEIASNFTDINSITGDYKRRIDWQG